MGGNCGFGVLALLLLNIGWRNTTNWEPSLCIRSMWGPAGTKVHWWETHTGSHTRHSMLFFCFLCLFSNKHLHYYVGTSTFHPRDDVSYRPASLDVFVWLLSFWWNILFVCLFREPPGVPIKPRRTNLLLITSSGTNLHPSSGAFVFVSNITAPTWSVLISVSPLRAAPFPQSLSCTDLRSNTALIGVWPEGGRDSLGRIYCRASESQ